MDLNYSLPAAPDHPPLPAGGLAENPGVIHIGDCLLAVNGTFLQD